VETISFKRYYENHPNEGSGYHNDDLQKEKEGRTPKEGKKRKRSRGGTHPTSVCTKEAKVCTKYRTR